MELTDYLGKEVRDVASGLTGLCLQVTEYLSGVRQVGIQPKSLDGTAFPETYTIDDNLIEVLGDGISSRVIPINQGDCADIKLGDQVRDKVTKFKGTMTHKSMFMNGCTLVCVTSELTEKEKPLEEWFNAKMVEKVESVAPVVPKTERKSGGPSMRAPRSC